MLRLVRLSIQSSNSLREKDIVFDFAKSLSFEGDSGPYIQYAHARINSVLRKAKEQELNHLLSMQKIRVNSNTSLFASQKWLNELSLNSHHSSL